MNLTTVGFAVLAAPFVGLLTTVAFVMIVRSLRPVRAEAAMAPMPWNGSR
jgi:hypothetical protein